MTYQLTPTLQLTTEHPSSSYEIPVLVANKNLTDLNGTPTAYGPADMLDYGGNIWPATKHVQRFAKHHLDNQDIQTAAKLFCTPQHDTP